MPQNAEALLEPVRTIWREVLGLGPDEPAVDSNFFLQGGDSLQLTRVLVRVRERLGVELDLREPAQVSTPSKMADRCAAVASLHDASLHGAFRSGLRQVVSSMPLTDCFPCAEGQSALWLAEQLSDTSGLYNTAVILHFSGNLQVPVLSRALTLLLRRHEVLRSRLRFDTDAQQLVAFIAPETSVQLHVTTVAPHTAAHHLRDLTARPFDLAKGPLWRFALVMTGSQAWSLLLCLHHCVTDGWSGGVLLRHLEQAYNALLLRPDWEPAQTEREYRRFCLQQTTVAEGELHWWCERLKGADRLAGWPPTANRRWPFAMASEIQPMPVPGLTLAQDVAHASGVQLSALLLAALRLAVRTLSGVEELCIGMPVNVRDTSAQEEGVGYFVNLLVLRDRIDAGMDNPTVLRNVQRSLSEALCHRATSFPALVQQLRPDLLPSGNPWCDILYAFQNLPYCRPAFAGLDTDVEALSAPFAQHPLKVEFLRAGTEWICRIEYACEVMTRAQVQALSSTIRHHVAALVAAVARSN
jgi:NRPS condensation-like uncharacterized protein/acyl carrier protein